jgi:hypothetical protein
MRVMPASHRVILFALGAILLAESLLSASWSFAQQATVRVSVERVNSGMFSTQYKRTYTGARRTTELSFDKFLIELYKKDPKLDSLKAFEIMQKFREDYNREINQGSDYNKQKMIISAMSHSLRSVVRSSVNLGYLFLFLKKFTSIQGTAALRN